MKLWLRLFALFALYSILPAAAAGPSFRQDEQCEPPKGGIDYQACSGTTSGMEYNRQIHVKNEASASITIKGDAGIGLRDEWTIECKVDKITDEKYCVILLSIKQPDSNSPATVISAIKSNKRTAVQVCVGYDHYPGTKVFARVDGGKPLVTTASSGGCFGDANSRKIMSGAHVVVQFQKWPSEASITFEGDMVGAADAVELAGFLIRNSLD
jgi:hypothetical protein